MKGLEAGSFAFVPDISSLRFIFQSVPCRKVQNELKTPNKLVTMTFSSAFTDWFVLRLNHTSRDCHDLSANSVSRLAVTPKLRREIETMV